MTESTRVTRYHEGMTLRQIAKQDGVSVQAVHQHLQRKGITFRNRGSSIHANTFQRKNLHQQGKTVQEIADLQGVDRRTVMATLRTHGIPFRASDMIQVKPGHPSELALSRLKRYNSGMTAQEIANEDGVKRVSVYNTLHHIGIYCRHHLNPGRIAFSRYDRWIQGQSINQIAKTDCMSKIVVERSIESARKFHERNRE